ncbi:MAG: class I SAM-dependent methyltransferase [bacterium]
MNNSNKTSSQIRKIKKAYDASVDRYNSHIEDESLLPEEFKDSERYKKLKKTLQSVSFDSDNPEIKKYLNPKSNMNFLDVGSCANLVVTQLHHWPSTYYGIDISPKLIQVTRNYVLRNNIKKVGGLYVTEVAKMPFENNFFNICAVIGVLEYFDIEYIKKSFKELHRVLKSDAKMVIDMPNQNHPDVNTMIELEEYLGRPRHKLPTNRQFEEELKKLFLIERVDDSKIMKAYFVRAKKK